MGMNIQDAERTFSDQLTMIGLSLSQRQMDQFRLYCENLLKWNEVMNLTAITDIDEKYIGSEIDLESLTKVTRQLQISMGSMMYLVDFFAVAIFMVLIYILSKIIIEKNAQSISMAKILGHGG